jgi:hypothetical protein
MGATEKRREIGAGVAVIGGIGVSGMGEAGRWGVYQDWACGAQVSLAEVDRDERTQEVGEIQRDSVSK